MNIELTEEDKGLLFDVLCNEPPASIRQRTARFALADKLGLRTRANLEFYPREHVVCPACFICQNQKITVTEVKEESIPTEPVLQCDVCQYRYKLDLGDANDKPWDEKELFIDDRHGDKFG